MSTGYTVKTVPTIAAIEQGQWRQLLGDKDPLWHWQFFRHMEHSGVGVNQFEYLLVYLDAELKAVLPIFLLKRYPLELSAGRAWRHFSRGVRKRWASFLTVRALFCGHPMTYGKILLAEPDDTACIDFLSRQVQLRAKQLGCWWVIFKDFPAGLPNKIICSNGFHQISGLPDAALTLDGISDFSGYLQSIKTSARRNIRSKQRHFQRQTEFTVEIEVWPDDLQNSAEALYQQVLERAQLSLDSLTAEFFNGLGELSALRLKTVLIKRSNQPVAFAVFLAQEESGYCLRVGMDYAKTASSMAYFILHYEVIRLALREQCKHLNFCQSTYTFKQEIGCQLAGRDLLIKHRNPLLHRLLLWTLPGLFRRYRKQAGIREQVGR